MSSKVNSSLNNTRTANTPHQKIRAIITGVTGMVGEGVLHECLMHPDVEQVLVINRKPCGVTHPKLIEILHHDFYDLTPITAQLAPYNACFFCLGVSSAGMKEADYERVTYQLTMHVAELLSRLNPDMTFCYITGTGTDSSEQGRSMWARVKGKTENHLLQLPFKRAFMFRPGYIHPTKGLRNAHRLYSLLSWLYPPLKRLFPNHLITLRELGIAMIHTVNTDDERSILEPKDILRLAAGG
ncbi:epimerase [Paenibacillus sp. FSL H7-0331]|uniref:epimerase n=1 Tax=Paenibacillus sp. FSL H7-0331 TaxID=1920421 RepID=UPI00096F8932|nr:epimerase [Paenibacillus sp. FSL H7-0331]OMF19179.1 epimerase [Paenibacillus sp. FSL H7-0331]